MKHLFIIAYIIVYIFFGKDLGYDAFSPCWKHITYNFQHANLMHLFLNSVSFYYLFRALERFIRPWIIASAALTSAVAASFLCIYPVPVVGSSGMVYAMIGMYFALVTAKRIRYREKTPLYVFLAGVAIFLTLSFIKPNSAGMLHLASLITSFTVSFIIIKMFPVNR